MARIYKSLEPITQVDIAAFEQWAEIKLPETYKQFLLETNGGHVQPYCYKYYDPSRKKYIWAMAGRLYGIGSAEDPKSLHKWVQKGAASIPIARDPVGNMLFLGVKGEDAGRVYYWVDHIHPLDQDTFFVAKDFGEFLEMLQDCPEDDE